MWRVRAGRFRIIYEVHDDKRLLIVLRIARRHKGTYRDL
ncbi:type II toxin-antitoxin system RelE family toxin [Candidatus Spongiisocius sp.]